jgi:type II secretory pathway pseudopilin PulG
VKGRPPEAGYTLIAVMAGVTLMLLTMAVGVPFWRHVVRDDREQELIFRGERIALAIERYQKRHANAPPASLEVLVEMKFLRKLYTDPMTESGEWRLIRQGEAIGPIRPPGAEGEAAPTPDPRTRPPRASRQRASGQRASRSRASQEGGVSGGIVGVASRSEESGLRLVNGRERYDEWLFVVGQVPVVVGKAAQLPGTPPVTLPGGTRGQRAPNQLPGPTSPRGRQRPRPGER